MSLLNVAPDMVAAASGNLANLGSALRSANAAAASQTTAVVAPAADEVSAAITALLGTHAQQFQTANAQAAAFHDNFVNLLNGGATQYVSAELANAQQIFGAGPGGMVGAAANAADTITPDFQGSNFSYAVGPFGVSGGFGEVTFGDGGMAVTGNVAVTLNTPFGSPGLVSGSAFSGMTGTGGYIGHIDETWPFGSFVTVDATGTFFPLGFTSLAYNFNGLEVSLPGTGILGPVVPNVSWNPTP
jgi:hypothetical protein